MGPASCCHACLRLAPDLVLPTSAACPADLLLPALACHARMLTCPVAPCARLTLPGARPAALVAPHRLARASPAPCCHACLRLAPDLVVPTSAACPAGLLRPDADMPGCNQGCRPCAGQSKPGARPAAL